MKPKLLEVSGEGRREAIKDRWRITTLVDHSIGMYISKINLMTDQAAYGKGSLITEYGKVLDVLESTIHAYEPVYQQQWNNLPDDFRSKMIQVRTGMKMSGKTLLMRCQ